MIMDMDHRKKCVSGSREVVQCIDNAWDTRQRANNGSREELWTCSGGQRHAHQRDNTRDSRRDELNAVTEIGLCFHGEAPARGALQYLRDHAKRNWKVNGVQKLVGSLRDTEQFGVAMWWTRRLENGGRARLETQGNIGSDGNVATKKNV